MNRTNALDPRRIVSRHRDADLIRRLRDVAAWLGEHGGALDDTLNQIPGETLVPALRRLISVVRRMGVEPRFSAELQAVLDERGVDSDLDPRVERVG